MPKTTKHNLGEVQLDFSLYPRGQVDRQHAATLREAHRAGAKLPAVIVDSKGRVVDGFHRVVAYRHEYNSAEHAIDVEVRSYASDFDMFLDACSLNSKHGLPLSRLDRARAALRMRSLAKGRAAMAKMAAALGLRPDTLRALADGRVAKKDDGEEIVLKRAVRHMSGQTLTPEQVDAQAKLAGNDQRFILSEVEALLSADLIDWTDPDVVASLSRIADLLARHEDKLLATSLA